MNNQHVLRIGIYAVEWTIGGSGGIAVYTRYLVEALAEYDKTSIYIVLVNAKYVDIWTYRQWPTNIRFVQLLEVEPRQPIYKRIIRQLYHELRLPVPVQYGESYIGRQIESLGLELIHYPNTLIYPLSITTPCILTFFDLQHEYYPQFFTPAELDYRARTYRPSVEKAIHIIVPSKYTRQTLIEKYSVPLDKMSFVPVGLIKSFQRPEKGKIDQVKAKYNLPEKFIFYPANPWPHKNHACLMAALRIYQEKYGRPPELVLSGRLQNKVWDAKQLAIAAGVEENIIDLGFVPFEDLPALYSAATLMVFPSLFEGFGIPLVEAMACGCPIAAANATAIPECVNNAALLFDPFDPGAIAEAVHQLINDQTLRHTLMERGYQQLGRYDWKLIVSQLLQIYKRVANNNIPPKKITVD
jgi:glycosyltransferase involved in cell wall biosynthesis